MAEPTVRAPRYLTRFRCIGPACEDHCCGGWQTVDVDVETYGRYREVEDPELGMALRRVAPNPDPRAGPHERALISVSEGGACPLFTSERLCAIQLRLGERLLPVSCDTFPRQATLIEGRIDLAGRLACPEVVRLALLAPDALDLVEVDVDRRLHERGRYWVERPWPDRIAEGDPRRHYHRVRELCLDLLSRREVALEARLQAVGLTLGVLSDWPGVGREEIERVFAEALARLPTPQRAPGIPDKDVVGPAELLLRRVRPWIAMRNLPPRYRASLDRLRAGLNLPGDPTAPHGEGVAHAYATAVREHLRPYLRARPYVVEHALLNHVLLGTFPFHPERSLFEEYALFVCRYGLLKLHLVGAAAAEGALTDELVVETVQAFDKYPDSPDYWDRTLALLRREGALNPAALATLARD